MHIKRIVIFTEVGKNIGFGHITRCSTLYDTAINSGYHCELIVFSDMNDIKQLKRKNSIIIDWKETDFLESYLKKDDFCIIDSYIADYKTYHTITEKSEKCIYIDDFTRIDYPKDGIIVNPSLFFDVSKYNGNECYNGMEYVILRSEFLNCKRSVINKNVKQILVTMGGSDPRNLTPRILELLNDNFSDIDIKVIIGKAFDNINEIKDNEVSNVELIFDADGKTMKEIMLKSDFAISAAGQTIYELLATQTPFIPIRIIDNQDNNINALLWNKLIDHALEYDTIMVQNRLSDAIDKMMCYKERSRIYKLYSQKIRFNDSKSILQLF